jgi:glycosyltransferase involved in cell wall biosynthesis
MHAVCLRGPSLRSLLGVVAGRRVDVIVIQKWTPPVLVVFLLKLKARRLIYDCDDAIYIPEVASRSAAHGLRNRTRLLGSMRLFDGATVSTRAMRDDFNQIRPGLPVMVFPGPMPNAVEGKRERSGIVWLGSPATEGYLEPIAPVLQVLESTYGFTAIGASSETQALGLTVETWSTAAEIELLALAAVGLFIQPDGEWERRKSGYKVLEYISRGVLPVAQDNESAREILGDDYPYLVKGDNWATTLDRACSINHEERSKVITELRHRTRQYSYDLTIRRWESFARGLVAQ